MLRKPVAPLPEEGGLHEKSPTSNRAEASVDGGSHRSTLPMAMAAEG